MSKAKTLLPQDKKTYGYPSRFGSHASMVNEAATTALRQVGRVVLTDEFGDYETDSNRLDDGTADPNRCKSSRLGKLFEKSAKEKKQ